MKDVYVTRSLSEAQIQLREWLEEPKRHVEMFVRPETPYTKGFGPLFVVRSRARTWKERTAILKARRAA